MLPEAARQHLEELLATRTHEYQSEFVRRYVFQRRARGALKDSPRDSPKVK